MAGQKYASKLYIFIRSSKNLHKNLIKRAKKPKNAKNIAFPIRIRPRAGRLRPVKSGNMMED